MKQKGRTIELRRERKGKDLRRLWAYLDEDGAVHIDGQDLGPATAPMGGDGEYEYFMTIAAQDVPELTRLLGGEPGERILAVVARYEGERSHELERLIRASDLPVEFFSC